MMRRRKKGNMKSGAVQVEKIKAYMTQSKKERAVT